MQHTHSEFSARDRSRRPQAKHCSMKRRDDRRGKNARLLLELAFPAELDAFAPTMGDGGPIPFA